MGVTVGQKLHRYTPEDDAFIQEHAGVLSNEEIGARLGVTRASIAYRCRFLGIKVRRQPTLPKNIAPWSAEDDAYVTEHYQKMPAGVIGQAIGRTRSAVRRRLEVLGLNTSGLDPEALKAIRRATLLRHVLLPRGGHAFTPEDDARIVAFYALPEKERPTLETLAKEIGCHPQSLTQRARRIRARKVRPHIEPFTEDQEMTIRLMYGLLSYQEIGRRIGRTAGSVRFRSLALGLRTQGSRYQRAEHVLAMFNEARGRERALAAEAAQARHALADAQIALAARTGALTEASAAQALGVKLAHLPKITMQHVLSGIDQAEERMQNARAV